jgi:hypothetical protein
MSFSKIPLPNAYMFDASCTSIMGTHQTRERDSNEIKGYAMPLPPSVVYAGRLLRLRHRIAQSSQRQRLEGIVLRHILPFPMRRNFRVTRTVSSSMYMHQRPDPPRSFPS